MRRAVFETNGLIMDGSTVSGNTSSSTQSGGGIVYSAAIHHLDDATIDRSTVAENVTDLSGSAATYASGILVQAPSSELNLSSSTIAANGPSSLTALGGVNLFVQTGTAAATLTNNILAEPSGDGANCIALGTIDTNGYNVDNSPDGPSCFVTPAATDLTSDPLLALAGVADNGGSTETIALQPTSPAIDAGSNVGSLSIDQRGLDRPVDFSGLTNATAGNGTDIGPFEVQRTCATQATPVAACPPPPGGNNPTPGPTGQRAKALKKCKKIKDSKKRKKCRKKAKKKPV